MRHPKASLLNDLDRGSREFDEWVTKNHMMLPKYLLDQIGILIQSRKQSCCMTELYPALQRTAIQDPSCVIPSPRKLLFDYVCNRSPSKKSEKIH